MAVGRRHDDVVDKDIVECSFAHLNPRNFRLQPNKCEFSFRRKGLSRQLEILVAECCRPVYKPALATADKLRFLLRS